MSNISKNTRPDGQTLLPYNLFDDLQDVAVVEQFIDREARRHQENMVHSILTWWKAEEQRTAATLEAERAKWAEMQRRQPFFHTLGVLRDMEWEAMNAEWEAQDSLDAAIDDMAFVSVPLDLGKLASLAIALETIREAIADVNELVSK